MIYILQMGDANGPVKIGFSKSPYSRIGSIAANWPYPPRLLAIFEGGTRREKALHSQFRAYHLRGEWFYPVKEILKLAQPGAHEAYLKSQLLRHPDRLRIKVKPNLPTLSHGKARERRSAMADAVATGISIRDVARQFNCSYGTVRVACEQFGLKIEWGKICKN